MIVFLCLLASKILIYQENIAKKICTELVVFEQRNDKDAFKQIFESMDMRSISTRKHSWHFGSMVPTPTRKHGMDQYDGQCLDFCMRTKHSSISSALKNGQHEGEM